MLQWLQGELGEGLGLRYRLAALQRKQTDRVGALPPMRLVTFPISSTFCFASLTLQMLDTSAKLTSHLNSLASAESSSRRRTTSAQATTPRVRAPGCSDMISTSKPADVAAGAQWHCQVTSMSADSKTAGGLHTNALVSGRQPGWDLVLHVASNDLL